MMSNSISIQENNVLLNAGTMEIAVVVKKDEALIAVNQITGYEATEEELRIDNWAILDKVPNKRRKQKESRSKITPKLFWYKATHPIEPYVFRDMDKAIVGYEKKQFYPEYQYIGNGTYEEIAERKLKQWIKRRKI